MANALPKRASSEAIRIINRAITDRRALAEIEKEKLMRLMSSMMRENPDSVELNTISACYYALVSDIHNLLISTEKVMADLDCGKIGYGYFTENALTALGNALMIKEVYKYMKKYKFPLNDMGIHIAELFMSTSMFMLDFKVFNELKESFGAKLNKADKINKMDDFYHFLLKNDKNSINFSSYICDVFDVISREISRKAVINYSLPPISEYDFELHNDDGYEFINFSFTFPIESDLDIVLALEDEMLLAISKLNYSSEVKTKISFDFSVGEE
ncbi:MULTISPECIES: hypothetical protein [Proteus]|uniref:hypothetical protein n=1 Tax=Proteus TaxID=583 RepID=UPI001BA5D7A6|nr:hypothetical protein [Proteus terrae]QUT00906.1 hypothetical protein KF949_14210 [Proteus terrae subsp. cibarius]